MSWRPTAPIANLEARGKILAQIRNFFAARGVLEVQTPIIGSHTVTDVNIHSIEVPGLGFLQTSPEYQMKRLLAAGMSSCYQIGPVFRADERGRWHHSEFTLLEWYRLGHSLDDLIQEVKDLFDLVLGVAPYEKLTVAECLRDFYQQDVFQLDELACIEKAKSMGLLECSDYADAFDFLLDLATEKRRARLILTDYPVHGAALAKVKPNRKAGTALRFEFFLEGLELANGYDELQDAEELERRMNADNRTRKTRGLNEVAKDEALLAAMRHGLPQCAGVAVGLDRLVATSLQETSLADISSFLN